MSQKSYETDHTNHIAPLFLLVLCSCKDKPKEATESSNNCLTAITIASILILIHSNAYIDNLRQKRNQNRIFAQQLETIKENICHQEHRQADRSARIADRKPSSIRKVALYAHPAVHLAVDKTYWTYVGFTECPSV